MKSRLQKIKPHLPYLLSVLIGGLLIYLVWEVPGNWGFLLGIIGGLLIIGGLKGWEGYFEKKVEEEDPYFYDDPVYDERWEKVLFYGSGSLAVIGFLGVAVSSAWFNNIIISKLPFLVISAVVGGFLASLCLYFLKKKYPHVFVKDETRYNELFSLWFGIAFIIFISIVALSFSLDPVSIRQEKVGILEHGATKNEGGIKVLYQNNKVLELDPNRNDYRALKGKDYAILTISKSPLGFEYVCEMLPE